VNNESEREEAQEDAPDTPKKTQPPTQNAADKFREQIQNTQETVDDYEPEEELWNGGYSAKAMVGTWLLLPILSVATLILTHPFYIFGFLPFFPVLAVFFLVWVVVSVGWGG